MWLQQPSVGAGICDSLSLAVYIHPTALARQHATLLMLSLPTPHSSQQKKIISKFSLGPLGASETPCRRPFRFDSAEQGAPLMVAAPGCNAIANEHLRV